MIRAGPAESVLKRGKAPATRNFEEFGAENLTRHFHHQSGQDCRGFSKKSKKIKKLERPEVSTNNGKTPQLRVKLMTAVEPPTTPWALSSRTPW